MEEPGRLQSMRLLRVGHNWATSLSLFSFFPTFTFHFHALEKEMATHSCALAWRIPGTEEPGGLPSMGSHRVGHNWRDLAAAAAAANPWNYYSDLMFIIFMHIFIIPLYMWNEVKVAQSCLTVCDPMDYIVHGILQARILEWVAIPFSRGSSQPRDRTQVSCIAGGFFTSWATREAPPPIHVCILK